jgi:pimeloyl-ACP methyl ester carboxylesterase
MSGLPPFPLPEGISSRQLDCPSINLSIHFLEAGYEKTDTSKKLVLLLHGFPEIAFSWRKVIPALASKGYYVVAPDQRGYGRTTGWDNSTWGNTDLSTFSSTALVRDMVVFVHALGYTEVHAVVGHDFGAVAASMCALMRPDMFKSLVLMSHPYKAIPGVPFGTAHGASSESTDSVIDIQKDLANLPEPRKHYRNYNSTDSAASDWLHPPQGLQTYLRGYFHVKSASWERNNPHPLEALTAEQMAKMPHYYIMPLQSTMPEVVSQLMRGEDASKTATWLSDADLAVYVQEWQRVGFQGGLNWYRARVDPKYMKDLQLFAGRSVVVPAMFISGAQDWGNHQEPGALGKMSKTCTDFRGTRLIDGAGHWPQQEQPERVLEELLAFFISVSV